MIALILKMLLYIISTSTGLVIISLSIISIFTKDYKKVYIITKKLIYHNYILAISILITSLIFGFVLSGTDINNWNIITRMLFIFINIVMTIVIEIISMELGIYDYIKKHFFRS